MNERRAYCGLLDDFALRHGDGRPIRTVEDLNDHLAFSVVAGDPFVINDGYLLNNPALREAIIRPSASPFRSLVESGFVRILSRNKGKIGSLCHEMANQGIRSAERLLNDNGFVDDYLPELLEWATHLNSGFFEWYRAWPLLRTNEVYGRTAARGLDALAEDSTVDAKSLEWFRGELDEVGSRTAWEETAIRLAKSGKVTPPAFRTLMSAANEAYQYAWACMLADAENPMSVQTRVPRLLGHLDHTVTDRVVTARRPVSLFVPDIRIARRGIRDQWMLLARAAHPSSEAHIAKRRFLTALAVYYAGGDVSEREMTDVAREYSETLSRVFGRERRVQTGLDLTFATASVGTSVTLAGLPGLAIGVAITAGGLAAGHVPAIHNLICRLGQYRPTKWIKMVSPADASHTATFELDERKVRPLLEGISTFEPGRR